MDKLVLDDDTKALVLAVKDLLKDLRARGLNDDQIDDLVKRDGPGRITLDTNGILTLPDYGNVKIYLNPMERTLYTLLEAAVDALCDDDRATLQTNVSRIKRKLVEKVGKIAADQYAIVRGKDNVYRIAVPRDLVIISA